MNENYPSFINGLVPESDYDCRELNGGGYVLRARCNKTNPDCKKYIKELEEKNDSVKIRELDVIQHGKDMIDIWVRQENPFRKIS